MLSEQKYNNVIRTVSGTVNVEVNDSVLNVTTASVAATINLQTFQTSKWSTQYKLYVYDVSGNAATNNITIVAPSGYTINGQASQVISTNNGSAIVRIVSNTVYQAQLSSYTAAAATIPYMYNQKLLQTALTNYIPIIGASIYSVVEAQQIQAFDSSVASNITGFNTTTGVWTVPSTGYYALSAKLITRLVSNDLNALTDISGNGWMTDATFPDGCGVMSIAIVVEQGAKVVCAGKQPVQKINISDINIECSTVCYPLTAGDLVMVQVLNKTNHDVIGFAHVNGKPDCILDFSVTKIS